MDKQEREPQTARGMPGVLTSDTIGRPPMPPPDGGYGGDGRRPDWGGSRRASFTALMVLLAATTMVFAALTSAYFMRRGVSGDWRCHFPAPAAVGEHGGAAGIERSSGSGPAGACTPGAAPRSTGSGPPATACGMVFLLGQAAVWRDLRGVRRLSGGESQQRVLLPAHSDSCGAPAGRNERPGVRGRACAAVRTGAGPQDGRGHQRRVLALSRRPLVAPPAAVLGLGVTAIWRASPPAWLCARRSWAAWGSRNRVRH